MAERFENISNCTYRSVAVTTIESITINTKHKEIEDSGDDNAHMSYRSRGPGSTDVTIELKSPVQARALIKGAAGDLSFTGTSVNGDTVGVTVEGVIFDSHRNRAMHGGLHVQTVGGGAAKEDGTDPVTIT